MNLLYYMTGYVLIDSPLMLEKQNLQFFDPPQVHLRTVSRLPLLEQKFLNRLKLNILALSWTVALRGKSMLTSFEKNLVEQ